MTPEVAPEPTERPKDPEGAAAPPALRNTPTPVVAPQPEVRLPVTNPLPASLVPGTGTAANPGAAEVPGPGTGRGGEGEGLGSGRSGDGTGGGGGGGVAASGPFHRSGEIDERDTPRGLILQRSHRATFRLLVGRNGRVLDCQITGSTGIPSLDAATCASAIRRLRWHPARDRLGRIVDAWAPGSFTWHPAPLPEEIRD
jgi:protein TonB